MTIAVRLWRDRERSLLWWSVAVVGLVLFTVAVFPSIRGQASFEDLARNLPQGLRAALGFEENVPITSAPGYLQARLFGTLLPLLLMMFGVGVGARAIGGAEEDGAIELLLANPVSRRRVVSERFMAALGLLASLCLIATASVFALAPLFGALEGVSLAGLLGFSLAGFLLAALHAALAFAVGAATGRRAPAVAIAGATAVLGYLVHGFVQASDVIDPARFVSPWHWYLGRNMLVHGIAPDALVVPVPLVALLFLFARRAFAGRDLR